MPALTSLRALQGAAGGAGGAAQLFVGSFTKTNSATTQAVTGVGFTPKALIFFTAGSAAASGTWTGTTGNIHQTVGFTTGAAESYSTAVSMEDNESVSDTKRRIAAKAITLLSAESTATQAEADLDSFDADGFTLDWTANGDTDLDDIVIMFIAIGGDDVSAKAITWDSPSSTGNKAVTGVGFEPEVVLHSATNLTTVPETDNDATFGFGAMDASGGEWALSVRSAESGTSITDRTQQTDHCIALLDDSDGTILEEADFVSMDSDGFTVDFTAVAGGQLDVAHISLCLSGLSATVGNFAKSTGGAPASQAVTGVGFEPGSVMFASFANVATTSVQTHGAIAMGAADGTNERSTLMVDEDGQSVSDAKCIFKNDKVLMLQDTTTGSIDAEADLTSMDADGFTLNWTTNDAVADQILYLALA